MMDKKHLERVLSVNGASTAASDEEIRALLSKARYSSSEIDIAMQVLRQNVTAQSGSSNEINRVFRSDAILKPEEISRLLQIDVNLNKKTAKNRTTFSALSFWHYVMMVTLALILSLGGVVALMYSLEFGIFHTTSAMQFYDGS